MSRLKSGGIILLLAVPFGLYIAWQVKGVMRIDLIVSDPPAEKGLPTPEQLAALRARADRWVGDVGKVVAVTFQFRPPTTDDTVSDPECTALMKAAAARAADLTDLEKFLSGVERPEYTGMLKERYQEWQASRAALTKAARAVEAWFTTPQPGVDGKEGAERALQALDALLAAYATDTRFSDRAKAAAWRVRGRVRVIDLLAESARGPFEKAINLKLPLPTEADSADVRKALGAPRAMREQARLLQEELVQIAEARLAVPEPVLAEARAAIKRAEDWAEREQLLALFAEPDLFDRPDGAAEWLAKVQAQFNRTATDDRTRADIRKKVQEYCAAYLPAAARLDAVVLLRGERVPRINVAIDYTSLDKLQPLDDLTDGLTEFNFTTRHKGFDAIRWTSGGVSSTTGKTAELRPTPKSELARAFSEARTAVTIWSADAVRGLKKKCEAQLRALQLEEQSLDELVGANPGAASGPVWTPANSKIGTRLAALEQAMAKYPELFQPPR